MSGFTLVEVLRALAGQLAVFESLLLLASAVHKIFNWVRTQGVVQQFGGVPGQFAAAAGGVALTGELAAAALLLLPAYRAAGAVLAASIWLFYLVLMVRAMVQGRHDVDCGCTFGTNHRPLGAFQFVRNAVLLCVALVVAFLPSTEGGIIAQFSLLLPASALLALYAAMDQVMALEPLRGGETS